jgi:hypothetical protein
MQTLETVSRYLRDIQMMYFPVHSVTTEILSSQLPRTTHAEYGSEKPCKIYPEQQK